MSISAEARYKAEDAIKSAENVLKETNELVSKALTEASESILRAEQELNMSRDKKTLNSSTLYENTKSQYQLEYEKAKTALDSAKEKIASGDYIAFLDAIPIAEQSFVLAIKARDKGLTGAKYVSDQANSECKYYIKRRSEKVKNAWGRVPGELIAKPLLFGFIGWLLLGTGGCFIMLGRPYPHVPFQGASAYVHEGFYGFLIGVILGVICGIYKVKKELE